MRYDTGLPGQAGNGWSIRSSFRSLALLHVDQEPRKLDMGVAKPVDQTDPVLSEKGSRLGGRVPRNEDVPVGVPTEVPRVVNELPRSGRVSVPLHLEDHRGWPVAEPYDPIEASTVPDGYFCLDRPDPRHAAEKLECQSFQLLTIVYCLGIIHSRSEYTTNSE
ncbi:MAG TPA: hypothetical protein VGX49_07525 [Jatrophihabitans sp.]|nr:hypothetical protein [Jatrophihabitans sp.]